MGITRDQSSNWQKLGELEETLDRLEAFGWILQDLGYLNEKVKAEYFKRDRGKCSQKPLIVF
jgi:hypothetical protein